MQVRMMAFYGANGLRVLEVGEHLSGAYAGLILCAQGATVRQFRRGLERRLDEVESAYFDRGRLVTADSEDLVSLAARADVLLTDLSLQKMRGLNLPTTEAEL